MDCIHEYKAGRVLYLVVSTDGAAGVSTLRAELASALSLVQAAGAARVDARETRYY